MRIYILIFLDSDISIRYELYKVHIFTLFHSKESKFFLTLLSNTLNFYESESFADIRDVFDIVPSYNKYTA